MVEVMTKSIEKDMIAMAAMVGEIGVRPTLEIC
jgi:hypothetical protein